MSSLDHGHYGDMNISISIRRTQSFLNSHAYVYVVAVLTSARASFMLMLVVTLRPEVLWDLRARTSTDILYGWKKLRCSRLLADSSWFQSFSSFTDLVILIKGSIELNTKWVTTMADIWKWRQCRQCKTTVQNQRWMIIKIWDMEWWWFVDFNYSFSFNSSRGEHNS